MLHRLKKTWREYPVQFWILFFGMLVSTIGSSMIWPFLTLYVSKTLSLPLTKVTSLVTMNAVMGLIFAFLAGPICDRLGRKWVMVISLFVTGGMYLLMSTASTFFMFAVCQSVMGAFSPLYRVGADAMMSDLVVPEKRSGAYSLLRMSNNLGVSVGPALGGFVASKSYTIAFCIAAGGLIFYSLLLAFRARETLPEESAQSLKGKKVFSGYGRIFRDREYMGFILAFTFTSMLASLVWVLLPVYSNANFGISEALYGWIPTTNAVMVVVFQYAINLATRRHKPMWMMTLGSAFYAVGTAAIALFTGFWGFWLCMVVTTIGELVLIPTATTYAANKAPMEMRGRYMSIYNVTSNIASATSPVLGGILNDNLGPQTIWFGGGVIGIMSVLSFALMALHHRAAGLEPKEAVYH